MEEITSEGDEKVESYSYNNNNQITEYKIIRNGKVISHTINSYDDGKLIIKKVIDDFGRSTITDYTYNEDGYLIKEEWRGGEGYGKVNYEYDNEGNMIVEERINYTEQIIDDEYYRVEISYDDEGKVIKEVAVESHGIEIITEYTYNENDKIVKIITIDSTGWENETVYTYDENGNVLSEIYTSSDGVYSNLYYAYNDNGQLIKKYSETSGEDQSLFFASTLEKYEYDDEGRLIKKEIHDIMKSSMLNNIDENITETYTYDENGNLIEKNIKYESGKSINIKYYYESY
jgi:hypothetical protein